MKNFLFTITGFVLLINLCTVANSITFQPTQSVGYQRHFKQTYDSQGHVLSTEDTYTASTVGYAGNSYTSSSILLETYDNRTASVFSCTELLAQLPAGAYNITANMKIILPNSGTLTAVHLPNDTYFYSGENQTNFNKIVSGAGEQKTLNGSTTDIVDITGDFTAGNRVVFGAKEASNNSGTSVNFAIEVNYSIPMNVTFKNFRDIGKIAVGINENPVSLDGPVIKSIKVGAWVNINAVLPQNISGYNMAWSSKSQWTKKTPTGSEWTITNSQSHSFTASSTDENANYISYIKRVCNLTVINNMSGSTSNGQLQVNGITLNSGGSTTANEDDQSTITVLTTAYDMNDMHYTFNHWEDGSTSTTRTVTPSAHATYTAYFTGKPLYSTIQRNLNVNNSAGQYIHLAWTEHSNPLVTSYQIWRKCTKGSPYSPMQIATVSRGTTSYTDWDYYNDGSQNQDYVWYSVDAYCQSENTTSDQAWSGIFFGKLIKDADSVDVNKFNDLVALDNSLGNYPNPFNPVTQIRYSIKENGLVSLKVYDILGNLVADLVNEYKPAGNYSVSFNASSLPSGIYISTIRATNYTETRKMLLVK